MIAVLATFAAILLAMPAVLFAVESILGLRPLKRAAGGLAPQFAVLIPAHNECAGIDQTVRAVCAQLRPGDRVIVVADNCTDDTAAIAKAAGAEVAERQDLEQRGKGFALAFGRDVLRNDPPSVVIVLDADCRIEGLERLAAAAATANAAVQSKNVLTQWRSEGALVLISSFAFLVKNVVRQRGMARLGAPALLQGTGMAFPWRLLAGRKLATSVIAEDLELGLDLILEGERVFWIEEAEVTSLAASRSATITQRTRWEHGFLTSASRNLPRLSRAAADQRRLGPLISAMDLLIPPLALLVAVTSFGWLVSFGLYLALGFLAPLFVFSTSVILIVVATALAWFAEGRKVLPIRTLMLAPLYVAWKLPIYLRLFGRRQRTWVRTDREGQPKSAVSSKERPK